MINLQVQGKAIHLREIISMTQKSLKTFKNLKAKLINWTLIGLTFKNLSVKDTMCIDDQLWDMCQGIDSQTI